MRRLLQFLFVGLTISFAGCQHKATDKSVFVDSLSFRDGDLLFREGPSIESRVVVAASDTSYSHVGILLRHDGRWMVVHAVPGETEDENDTIKCEPIREFLRCDRCLRASAKRVDCSDSVAESAARYAYSKVGLPFDNGYDLTDTARYYCTELLWQAYMHQGIDITNGRRHKKYIFPEDVIPVGIQKN